MNNNNRERLLVTLTEVIATRQPSAIAAVDRLRKGQALTEDECDLLADVVSTELVERGLGPDDEPNDYGLLLERVIDLVMQAKPSHR